jgi:hypothetical protein
MTMELWLQREMIFRTYIMKYLRVWAHDICNRFSSISHRYIDKIWQNIKNMLSVGSRFMDDCGAIP